MEYEGEKHQYPAGILGSMFQKELEIVGRGPADSLVGTDQSAQSGALIACWHQQWLKAG